jgi:hypothetical protein
MNRKSNGRTEVCLPSQSHNLTQEHLIFFSITPTENSTGNLIMC